MYVKLFDDQKLLWLARIVALTPNQKNWGSVYRGYRQRCSSFFDRNFFGINQFGRSKLLRFPSSVCFPHQISYNYVPCWLVKFLLAFPTSSIFVIVWALVQRLLLFRKAGSYRKTYVLFHLYSTWIRLFSLWHCTNLLSASFQNEYFSGCFPPYIGCVIALYVAFPMHSTSHAILRSSSILPFSILFIFPFHSKVFTANYCFLIVDNLSITSSVGVCPLFRVL